MKKLTLMAAVSALTLGATAHASELELKITNINGDDVTPEVDDGSSSVDSPDFALLPIDQKDPFTHEPLPPIFQKVLQNNVIFANERFVGNTHPRQVKFELNATAINLPPHVSPGPTPLPDTFLVQVDISGGTFISTQGVIRPGKIDEAGNLVNENELFTNDAGTSFVSNVQLGGNNVNTDPDVGLSLSITQDDCTPIVATVSILDSEVSVINGQISNAVIHGPETITLSECAISQAGEIEPGVIKADFEEDFKGFLTADHAPIAHDEYARVGQTHVAIWNNLFDPKAAGFEARRLDVTDLDADHGYALQVTFEDLTGIDSARVLLIDEEGNDLGLDPVIVDLGGRFASETATAIDVAGSGPFGVDAFDTTQALRAGGVLNFYVPQATLEAAVETIECSGGGDHPVTIDCEQNLYFALEVSAFGQKKKTTNVTRPAPEGEVSGPVKEDNGNGVIAHQVITASHRLNFSTPCKAADGSTVGGTAGFGEAFFDCTQELGDGEIGVIDGSGQNFGPFDWVSSGGQAQNFFRVTHIPSIDGHGNPLTSLKGELTLKNSAGNASVSGTQFDGTYKFDLPINLDVANRGRDGVYLINSAMIANIVADGSVGFGGNFGQSDISMTFFVNSVPGSARVGTPLESAFTEDFLPGEEHAFLGNLANYKLDVDRLILSGGTFAPYGDNSNDGFSIFTISGDDGRFGPKTPLKTKGFVGELAVPFGN